MERISIKAKPLQRVKLRQKILPKIIIRPPMPPERNVCIIYPDIYELKECPTWDAAFSIMLRRLQKYKASGKLNKFEFDTAYETLFAAPPPQIGGRTGGIWCLSTARCHFNITPCDFDNSDLLKHYNSVEGRGHA